jgi:ubiquinone/menaquinone biosynthesis C-methylase UbiE
MTESWYERNLLPYLLDLACGVSSVSKQRQKVIPQAQGQVLEIGIGTGLNMPFYDKTRVKMVVGVDPALRMHRLALKRSQKAGIRVRLIGLSAEHIPIKDASFDTVVSTYTLCTIADPVAALKEMRRALKPGGKLLFSEHGKSPDANVLKWQRRLQPYWKKMAGACMLDRDIPALLEEAGFNPNVQSRYIPGPKILSYHYWGEAVAA